jgi:protein-tyrosine-phosphatase
MTNRTEVVRPVTELLVLCTGNAARSVMAGFMLEMLDAARNGADGVADVGAVGSDLHIVTGGTHTVDGQPMGLRTRTALSSIPELAGLPFGRHRSRQVSGDDLVRAELVVVMEADHVRFVRRQFPEAADRTATIRRLCEDLPPGPPSLAVRVAELDLAAAALSNDDDVVDPAGGDGDAYDACVNELWSLCQTLITLL